MRRVVHLSDIHFGNNDPSLLAPLRETILSLDPHVLVLSGDFVEHATEQEFREARAFIDTLPKPQICVPGNHDLAFYNILERAAVRLHRYKRFITPDLNPCFSDDEIAIVGANTSRVAHLRGGSLSSAQLLTLEREFSRFPESLTRILVTHHPFDLPEGQQSRLIVGHARRAVAGLAPFVDILLAGHIHLSSTGSTSTRYRTGDHAMAFVQAGTAVSHRNKGEVNSFNLLLVDHDSAGGKSLVVERFSWEQARSRFEKKASTEYRLGRTGWAQYQAPPASDHVEEIGPKECAAAG
jgi:3',5'-cyclic AMP phosphodiesterase CpdA